MTSGLPPAPAALLVLAALLPPPAAATVDVPVVLDYRLVRANLAERVYTEEGERVQLLRDTSGCNSLVMAAPRVDATGDGRVRVRTLLEARGGTPVGGGCLLPFSWRGTVELKENAYLGDAPDSIAFRITDSALLDAEGSAPSAPGVLWGWVKQYVHPRLEGYTFDLGPLVAGTRDLLRQASLASPEAIQISADSLHLAAVAASARGLTTTIRFEPPFLPEALRNASAAPLTAQELAAWDEAWQSWDAFATWAIKHLAGNAPPALREAFAETLVDARYALRDALAAPVRPRDPVRELFLHTWERLAPLVAQAGVAGDGADAIRMVAFASAGDALAALDSAGDGLGLRLDRDLLRRFARALAPTVEDAALTYDTAVDPALRALLGLPPAVPLADARTPPPLLVAWLLREAWAGELDPELRERLIGWVPSTSDLDSYLGTMDTLLTEVIRQEEARSKVAEPFRGIYRNLVRATAWQETCWRQYIEKKGEVQPLRSSAGSVGLMQINKHVWRGVYEVAALEGDVTYNAVAGNEILVHYLVDYAIRKKEHEASGSADNLARATYAVYNGGPGHLRRYRETATKASLRAIDDAFWDKYRRIREDGAAAVKACYGQ